MRAADLLPLQQEVRFQQMAVFSAQLQLIEEQRESLKFETPEAVKKPINYRNMLSSDNSIM